MSGTPNFSALLPSHFCMMPMGSVEQSYEAERVACNVMVILKRTGNTFREFKWDDYRSERLKDSGFTDNELFYFNRVIRFCEGPEMAMAFSPTWRNLALEAVGKEPIQIP